MARVPLLLAVLVSLGVTASHAETLKTDLTKALVPLEEIVPGGPPPDGIPAIDRPAFVTPAQAAGWITPGEPVLPDAATWAQAPPPPTPPRPEGTAPPRPRPRPRLPDTPMATICSTSEGWCPIKPVVLPGTPCECFIPPDTRIPGVARFFLYEEPVSPYLNPHRN